MVHNLERYAYQLEILAAELPPGAKIVDVGGGLNLFGPAAVELGFEYHLVDDLADPWHHAASDFFDWETRLGVRPVSMDIVTDPFPFESGSVDAVVSFDVLEHLHGSPRPMLHEVNSVLRDGGTMFLGVPNCVNLRKRITVPFGRGKWSTMAEWYGEPVFRGHVREPDTGDLRYIANDVGLTDVRIMGRNWYAYGDRYRKFGPIAPIADRVLRVFPALCSNIYLLGRKA